MWVSGEFFFARLVPFSSLVFQMIKMVSSLFIEKLCLDLALKYKNHIALFNKVRLFTIYTHFHILLVHRTICTFHLFKHVWAFLQFISFMYLLNDSVIVVRNGYCHKSSNPGWSLYFIYPWQMYVFNYFPFK